MNALTKLLLKNILGSKLIQWATKLKEVVTQVAIRICKDYIKDAQKIINELG